MGVIDVFHSNVRPYQKKVSKAAEKAGLLTTDFHASEHNHAGLCEGCILHPQRYC